MSTCVAALYAAAGGPPASGTPAQQLVDDWASGGAGSDGFAMVFEDAGGTDAPSIYVKDSGTPANDTDINLTDDFDAFNSFLAYTSPSPKIVRQSDGDLKYCAHNLSPYLNDWTEVGNATRTNGITDFDGGTTAVRISVSSDGDSEITRSLPSTTAHPSKYTVYAKYVSGTGWCFVGFGASVVWFDVQNGTKGNEGGSATGSITSAGGGWYILQVNLPAAATSLRIQPVDANSSSVADAGDAIDFCFSHLRYTPTDETYLPTTTAARYALPIQHDSSNNAEGLLVEPAATNLLTSSNDFSSWSQSDAGAFTLTANDATGPDGLSSMTKLEITDSTNERHRLFLQYTVGSHDDCTHSIYVKPGTLRYVGLRGSGGGWAVAVFDLQTLTVTSEQTDGTATIVDSGIVSVGGGIYRLHLTFNPTGTATPNFLIQAHSTGTPTLDAGVGSETFAGTAGQYIHIFGAQTELGSVPTSPIITTGATATRAADDIAGATSTIPWDEGVANTVYAKVVFRRANGNYITEIAETEGSLRRHAFVLGAVSPSSMRGFISGVFDDETTGTVTLNSDSKYACAIATDDYAHTLNGATVETDTSGTAPGGVDIFTLGHRVSTNGSQLNGLIKEIMFIPERMSNTDLVSITT